MEFGHRHLKHIYIPLLDLDEDGITYRGKFYGWSEIKKVRKYDNLFDGGMFYQARRARTYVDLADGKRIIVMACALEQKGADTSIDMSGKRTKAYSELIKVIEEKSKVRTGSMTKPGS